MYGLCHYGFIYFILLILFFWVYQLHKMFFITQIKAFFFLIDKQSRYIQQKESTRGPREYIGRIQRVARSRNKPALQTKLGNTHNISNKRMLAHEEKEFKKHDFNLVLEKPFSSNTTLFLSFQIAQIKQRGTALQSLKSFFRIRRRSQPNIRSFTRKGQTQLPPDNEKMAVHMFQTFGQWIVGAPKSLQPFHTRGTCWAGRNLSF